MDALDRAIDIVGGQSALGRLIGVKQQRIWHWVHKSQSVPAECVIPIERATGGQVSRHELRPDLYPPDSPDQRLAG